MTTMPYRVARYRLLLVKDGTLPTRQILRKYGCALGHAASLVRVTV